MALGPASDDVQIGVSTEAATAFVNDFYQALQSRRKTIATFYIPPSSMQGGKPIPTILFNGSSLQNGSAVQEKFENEMPATQYDAQAIDCHVLNPQYVPEGAPISRSASSSMTILIIVSGAVRLSDDRNDAGRQFSETFVLVPNHDRGSKGSRPKDFLIQSQNFRLVV